MPCNDGGVPYRDENPLGSLRENEAVICAVFTVLENEGTLNEVIKQLDCEEAGVAKSRIIKWWENHKREDAARREREAAERKRQALRKQALAKLTPEERKVLGIF